VTSAKEIIQPDRYSNISKTGSSIALIDTVNTFNGWKTILDAPKAWVQYNTVDFGSKKLKTVQVKALSENGSTLQIRLDKVDGLVIAEVKIPKGKSWNTVEAKVSKFQSGIHHLFLVMKDTPVEIDWVSFKN